MSETDEDPEVFIQFDDKEESFSVADANSGEMVRHRFNLDYEPACVYTKGKNKRRIEFGKLKGDKSYIIERQNRIPKHHVQNTLFLSMAVYKKDQREYLNNCLTHHKIHTICGKSLNSDILLAVGNTNDENTLYVTFRGTSSWDDIRDDLDVETQKMDSIPGGRFHSGFFRRAAKVSVEEIMEVAELKCCKTVVTCGHSLGGAVSSIVAINLLKYLEERESEDVRVYNVTFGAPFFGNKVIKHFCNDHKIAEIMLHHVGHTDIVPAILSLGHTIRVLSEKTSLSGDYSIILNILERIYVT